MIGLLTMQKWRGGTHIIAAAAGEKHFLCAKAHTFAIQDVLCNWLL
jgi:hypothetical protein